MTKADWISATLRVVRGTYDRSLHLTDVEKTLEALCETAAEALKNGDEIPLPGIGKLKVEPRAARKGRNPRTGAAIDIPAHNKAVLAESKLLKEMIN